MASPHPAAVSLSPFPAAATPHAAPPSSGPERASLMIDDVRRCIAAAGGVPEAFSCVDQGTDDGLLEVSVRWTLTVTASTQTHSGPPRSGFTDAKHIEAVKTALRQTTGMAALAQRLNQDGLDMLRVQSIPDLGPQETVAHVYSCPSCYGTGKTRCSACSGTGSQEENVTVQDGDKAVVTRRSTRCTSCGGSGSKRCTACDGTGHKTDVTTLSVGATVATSFVELRGHASDRLRALSKTLRDANILCALPLRLTQHEKDGSDNLSAVYQGRLQATFVTVSGPGLPAHTLHGIGPDVRYLNPAPVLDDLVRVPIAALSAARRTPLTAFNALRQIPLLDEVMRSHAKSPETDPAVLFGTVAHHLVSAEMAKTAGHAIARLMRGVAPRYTAWVWMVTAAVAAPATALTAILSARGDGLLAAGIGGLLWLAGLGTALPLTLLRRQTVPQAYRPPVREWKPALLTAALIAVMGLVGTLLDPAPRAEIQRWFDTRFSGPLSPSSPPKRAEQPTGVSAPTPSPQPPGNRVGMIDTATLMIDGRPTPLTGLKATPNAAVEAGVRRYLSDIGPLRCKPAGSGFACQTESGADVAEIFALSGFAEVLASAPKSLLAAQDTARKARTGLWATQP